MTKEQLLYLRELHQKDDGTGHHMSGIVSIVFDGGVSYEMNNISPEGARHMVIWDDDNEIVSACAHNTDFFTQAQQPFKIMSGVYANIHYMEGIYSMKSFIKTIDENFTMLTDEQKEIIKEWANHVRNCQQQPRPLPYYDKNAIAVPHPNQHICREEAPKTNVVKTVKSDDLKTAIASAEEGTALMVQGTVEENLEIKNPIKLIGGTVAGAINASEDAKSVVLQSIVMPATGSELGDYETPKASKNYLCTSYAPVSTFKGCTFNSDDEAAKMIYSVLRAEGEDVLVEDCTFVSSQKVHNVYEASQKTKIKSMVLRNCQFVGSQTHNCISIFDFVDGATVTIENCTFEDNYFMRISNYSSAKNVKIIFKNCWWKGIYHPEHRAGFVVFQRLESKNDDFSGLNLQFINCMGNDRKVITSNMTDGHPLWYCIGNATTEPVVTYR